MYQAFISASADCMGCKNNNGWNVFYIKIIPRLHVNETMQQKFQACLRLVYPMLPVSLDCSFLIAPSVFSYVYLPI